jgi:uncharacterized membrane protein YeaQ/YmgE (transglycosylase-associated protein family)
MARTSGGMGQRTDAAGTLVIERETDFMDPQIISWIISLVAGSAGGNIVGVLLKNKSLGPMLNTILGLVGGGVGGKLLPMLVPALQSFLGGGDVGTGSLSAIVGALLPLIVSFLKKQSV